jgi:hypothetical protein
MVYVNVISHWLALSYNNIICHTLGFPVLVLLLPPLTAIPY